MAHTHEFLATRDDKQILRLCLFPREVLSIFGIAEAHVGYPPNLSALQNYVTHLIAEGRLVSLELDESPRLTYLDEGEKVTLMLKDRPRIQQIFWNGHFSGPSLLTSALKTWWFLRSGCTKTIYAISSSTCAT